VSHALVLGRRTAGVDGLVVMAIVNRNPDSFFAGAHTFGLAEALECADQVIEEGADIGGVKAAAGSSARTPERAVAEGLRSHVRATVAAAYGAARHQCGPCARPPRRRARTLAGGGKCRRRRRLERGGAAGDAPYGVAYVVALWTPASGAS